MSVSKLPNRYHSNRHYFSRTKCLSDCFALSLGSRTAYRVDSRAAAFTRLSYQCSTVVIGGGKGSIAFHWEASGGGRGRLLTRFDSGDNRIRQLAIRWLLSHGGRGHGQWLARFDSDALIPRQAIRGLLDSIRNQEHRLPNHFHIDGTSEKPYLTRLCVRYNACHGSRHRLPLRFHSLTPSLAARHHIRFDACGVGRALQNARKMAFVRPGWRIIAHELETQTAFDLGFIDADSPNRVIDDIHLPDGEYEIFVTTSSLFWKDAMDRNLYRLSVRPGGAGPSDLPIIHNLRSSLAMGLRTIHWSASPSEVSDCVFGVWFGKDSPVDISRTPDQVIWYLTEAGEYTASLEQKEPTWVSVAAMRTGNEPETGPATELFLDWDDNPPRRPDGIVLLDFVITPPETEETVGVGEMSLDETDLF